MKKTKYHKKIRLTKHIYVDSSHVFLITICTYKRRPLFDNPTYSSFVYSTITGNIRGNTTLYAATILPDHVHLLLSPAKRNLIDEIGAWKTYTTNSLHKEGVKGPIWQKSFHDHVLRKEEDITEIANYILANPIRLGLCKEYTEYPYNYWSW